MAIQDKLRKSVLCLVLGFGSLIGLQMRPEEIEELMYSMNQPRVEMTVRDEADKDDPVK